LKALKALKAMLPPAAVQVLACEACALDTVINFGHRKPSVASIPEGFHYKGQRCYTACFTHRNILDMPPPDDWKPLRNNGHRDSFMMDFENEVLRAFGGAPRGIRRHLDPQWAALVRHRVDPHHTDVTWAEYVEWVRNGGGDEWVKEEAQEGA
jgi:hypothetical protein